MTDAPKPEPKGVPKGPLKHHPPRDGKPVTDEQVEKWKKEQGR